MTTPFTPQTSKRAGYVLHVLTASGAAAGLVALQAVFNGQWREALLWLIVCQVLDGLEEDDFQQNEIYFTLSDTDLFQAIKYAEKKNWTLGSEIGIISLNDHPFKEIIAGGITVVSTHPEKLGQKAAEMILNNQKTAEVIEPSLLIRKSL